MNVFICYRHNDAPGSVGHLYDRIRKCLGKKRVFRDVYAIDPGAPFPQVIGERLRSCQVMLVVIGPHWLSAPSRLDDPRDFVRIEIRTALMLGIRVIPVLVAGGAMPTADVLPDDLSDFAARQSIEVSEARFDEDAKRLIRSIRPRRRMWWVVIAALMLVALAVAAVALRTGGEDGSRPVGARPLIVPSSWRSEWRRVAVMTPTGEESRRIRYFTNTVGMEFVEIPAGDFSMGSVAGDTDERPVHRVRVSQPFYLQAREVSNAQYKAFVSATGYAGRDEADRDHLQHFAGGLVTSAADDCPAALVSWKNAQAFCRWLTNKEKVSYRLPTEAEWEYACRAGSVSRYWWGEDEKIGGKCANVADKALKKRSPKATTMDTDDGRLGTAPVGTYSPNAWGLYDMTGNVSELCQDLYGRDYYRASPDVDPLGPTSGTHYVYRGGGWASKPSFCRSACRGRASPRATDGDLGFRVVAVPTGR